MEENTNIIDTEICENEENISDISKDPITKKIISFTKKCFLPENLKKTVLVLIAFVLVICIVITTLVYFSPDNVAKRFVEASESGNILKAYSLMAYDVKAKLVSSYEDEDAYFEYLSNRNDEYITSWRDLSKFNQETTEEYYEDIYGNYKITVEVTRTKDISFDKLVKDELGRSVDILESFGFDRDSVTDTKAVTVKWKIKGEDETDRVTYTVWVVKVNGFWKVLDYDFDWD